MKKAISYLLLLTLVMISCSPNDDYTTDLRQAKKWFTGEWKLVRVDAMLLSTYVPDVQLIILGNKQIAVIEDGKLVDKVEFEIVQTAYNLQLKTNAQYGLDNWYVRNPALQISNKRMYLDIGRAADMPGYEFKRVK